MKFSRDRKKKALIPGVIAGILFFLFAFCSPVFAESASLVYDLIGKYEMTYVGNTSAFEYWNKDASGKTISRVYRDRADIAGANSTAVIQPANSTSRIAKAYLVWETRSAEGPSQGVHFYTPGSGGIYFNVMPELTCKDTRTTDAGISYTGMYCMAAEVTEFVTGMYGGYGAYTVANIPLWEGPEKGEPRIGGDSVCSWQLIIIEESPEFTDRTVSLNIMGEYVNAGEAAYTSISLGVAASPTGSVKSNLIYGQINVESDYHYDFNAEKNFFCYDTWFQYYTPTRGLYINGVCINSRDQDVDGNLNGGIRVHMAETKILNGQSTSAFKRIGGAGALTQFLSGASAEILIYGVEFDANGGRGTMDGMECIYGRSYAVPRNQYVPPDEGYVFDSWNKEVKGNDRNAYWEGSSFANLRDSKGSVILYAQWKPVIYRITLDSSNADSHGTTAYYEWFFHENYRERDCNNKITKVEIPVRRGRIFEGYYEYPDGKGRQYIDAEGYISSEATDFSGDTTLYAAWSSGKYKITLDNENADMAGTENYYVKYGQGNYADENCTMRISVIDSPGKVHYSFGGYYTMRNGKGQQIISVQGKITEGTEIFASDTVLYAYWIPEDYIITLDSQGATGRGSEAYYQRYGVCNYIEEKVPDEALERKTQIFNYSGAEQIFVAPYTGSYMLETWGAAGGGREGGKGGYSMGMVELTEGDELYLFVGGKGGEGRYGAGGWNGGGNGGADLFHQTYYQDTYYNGGGGATDIRRYGTALANRILVAGGGGGSIHAKVFTMGYDSASGGEFHKYWDIEADGGDGNGEYGKEYAVPGILYGYNQEYNSNPQLGIIPYVSLYGSWLSTEAEVLEFFVTRHTAEQFGSGWSTRENSPATVSGTNPAPVNNFNTPVGGDQYANILLSAGGFGYAAIGCGSGYYGGSLYASDMKVTYLTSSHANPSWHYVSQHFTAGYGGSGYIGGVMDGSMEQGVQTGNGCAKIHYADYNSFMKETSIITIPAKTGYLFGGYYTEPDGQGICYVDSNGNILSGNKTFTGDVTLYASWLPEGVYVLPSYSIIFHPNGGSGEMEALILNYDESGKLPPNQFVKETEYGFSQFTGWNTNPQAADAHFEDEAEILNLCDAESRTITLYAIWDDCPWILANDLYYTLEQAVSGYITQEELLEHAKAYDGEEGNEILPGENLEQNTLFWIPEFDAGIFTELQQEATVIITYEVRDAAGNSYEKRITVYVVDTSPVAVNPEGVTRFINEFYYSKPWERGGLEEASVWKTQPDYVMELEKTFANMRNNTPEEVYVFSRQDVLKMRAYGELHGVGNSAEAGALEQFYQEFMEPNRIK